MIAESLILEVPTLGDFKNKGIKSQFQLPGIVMNNPMIQYTSPDITMVAGIVNTHAATIFVAVAQRTDATPFVMPTPIMAPVMVCVVLTGIPRTAVPINVNAPDVSAQNPWTGFNRANPSPKVLITFFPPTMVPKAITE